jgi:hypothetical protein
MYGVRADLHSQLSLLPLACAPKRPHHLPIKTSLVYQLLLYIFKVNNLKKKLIIRVDAQNVSLLLLNNGVLRNMVSV